MFFFRRRRRRNPKSERTRSAFRGLRFRFGILSTGERMLERNGTRFFPNPIKFVLKTNIIMDINLRKNVWARCHARLRKNVAAKPVFRKNGLKSWSGGPRPKFLRPHVFWPKVLPKWFWSREPSDQRFLAYFSKIEVGKNVFFEKSIFSKKKLVICDTSPI